KLADDCFFYDKDRLPHGDALAILKSRVRPVVEMKRSASTTPPDVTLPKPSLRRGPSRHTTTPRLMATPSPPPVTTKRKECASRSQEKPQQGIPTRQCLRPTARFESSLGR